jgi:L-lysine exporter family protein LysE/ArgO
MRYVGAAFLIVYGAQNLRSAFAASGTLSADGVVSGSLGRALAACLALTWLNPHVYLDTLLLLGAISTRFPGRETAFALGAATGSFLFFFLLGYGAKALRPVFTSRASWRALETTVALTMWGVALRLLAVS